MIARIIRPFDLRCRRTRAHNARARNLLYLRLQNTQILFI